MRAEIGAEVPSEVETGTGLRSRAVKFVSSIEFKSTRSTKKYTAWDGSIKRTRKVLIRRWSQVHFQRIARLKAKLTRRLLLAR